MKYLQKMKALELTQTAAAAALILILSSQLVGWVTAEGRHYVHVVPDSSGECHSHDSWPCFTFSESLQRAEEVFASDTSVEFSAGEYIISTDTPGPEHGITISRAINLILTGPDSPSDQVHINCHRRFKFEFVECDNLTIANMVFSSCGSGSAISFGALIITNIGSLTVANVTVQHSHGYGLMGIYLSGNITISHCKFFNNSQRPQTSSDNYLVGMGGNCLLQIISRYIRNGTMTRVPAVLIVLESEFINGIAGKFPRWAFYYYLNFNEPLSGGGGLGVHTREDNYGSDITVLIDKCKFVNNSADYGGNLLLYINNCIDCRENKVSISIVNSTFQNGTALSAGGGLHVSTTCHNYRDYIFGCVSVQVYVTGSQFISNRAKKGGGVSLTSDSSDSNTYDVILSRLFISENTAEEGGGMYMSLGENIWGYNPLYIEHSKITLNSAQEGGGIYILITADDESAKIFNMENIIYYRVTIYINDSIVIENKGEIGSALKLQGHYKANSLACGNPISMAVWLKNVSINANSPNEANIHYGDAAVHVHIIHWLVLQDTGFYNNTGGGVYSNNSDIILFGKVFFEYNFGYSGGAIQLDSYNGCGRNSLTSLLQLMGSSHTIIANNRALEYGGGIGVSERRNDPTLCFYQIQDVNLRTHGFIEMKDNHADVAGDDIYGVSTMQCQLYANNYYEEKNVTRRIEFDSVFKGLSSTLSSVSSTPYHVCFCSKGFDSPKKYCLDTVERSAFLGQEFNVSAVAVGNHRGASPATVQTQFNTFGVTMELGTRQQVQRLERTCGELTYSVKTLEPFLQLQLIVEGSSLFLNSQFKPAFVNVTILPCPLGFAELGNPPECACLPHLTQAQVVCDIQTQTHHCPAGMWIGNFSGGITTHPHCPYDYCKSQRPSVSLTSQHEQCQYSRSGVLCGACRGDLSLCLGTSQCKKCSNFYIFLLLPFMMAGVVLVFLLLKCNLTVSYGTINGLIFYANIIRANQAIFFPRDRAGILVSFFSTFIAWLNLDLGIEVCFFNGLDAYGRVWLQFLFPAYIWILVGVVIVTSRYSTRMAKLTGNNAVPVLATLFLLSYTKLLRTVIDSVSFTTITDAGGDTSTLWLIDGNIRFLKVPHIFLFLAALIAVFVYILPFTSLALLAPYLQAKSNYRVLRRWVNKMKPLLDAYQGPYKDKFRFWTGFLLVVRVVLFITFASNVLGDPRVNLLAISISLLLLYTILWNTGQVYKSRLTHILECVYILNLGIYTAATEFLVTSDSSPYRQEQLACIMVGTAFLVFSGTLVYHLYTQLQSIAMFRSLCSREAAMKWCRLWPMKARDTEGEVQLETLNAEDDLSDHLEGTDLESPAPAVPPTVSVVDFSALREPLLTT